MREGVNCYCICLSNSIEDRISNFDFIENEDYKLDSPLKGNQNNKGGDRKTMYYSLTLDMAKGLSMVYL